MPFAALLLLAVSLGLLAFLAARRYPEQGGEPITKASVETGEQIVRVAARSPWLSRLLHGRLDPGTATGLALTLALVAATGGGIVVGVLAFLMRSSGELVEADRSVGQWGQDNASHWSTQLLQFVTDLAGPPVAIAVVVAVIVFEAARPTRSRWVAPFLITVMVGEVVLVDSTKDLLQRVRPTFSPIAATLGPSFPSGHSATAAALYASVALVLGRDRRPLVRALLVGAAVAIAVAVACSRVLLGVHWMSDVVAGLAFGWAWFAVCAIAFGGRFLRFGRPVELAAEDPRTVPREQRRHTT